MANTKDPFSIKLNIKEVDTSWPTLPAMTTVMEVHDADIVPSKDDPERFNLMFIFKTTQELVDVTGAKTIPPGFQLRKYYPMQPSLSNPKSNRWIEDITKAVDAIFNITDPKARPEVDKKMCEQAKGNNVQVQVRLVEGDYPNEVGTLKAVS